MYNNTLSTHWCLDAIFAVWSHSCLFIALWLFLQQLHTSSHHSLGGLPYSNSIVYFCPSSVWKTNRRTQLECKTHSSKKKNRRIICSFKDFFLIKKIPLTLDDLKKYIKSQTMKKKPVDLLYKVASQNKVPLKSSLAMPP